MPKTVRLDCFCVTPCCLLLSSLPPQVAGNVAEQPRVRLTPVAKWPNPPPLSTPGESANQVPSKARPCAPWRVPQALQQQEQQQHQQQRSTMRRRSTLEVRITTWGHKKTQQLPEGGLDCILGQDITIDLRAIWDPQGAQQLKHCTGRNGTIQLRLLMMQEFRDIIFSCKSLCEHAAETRQPLNLGLFCNSGRHRSVALGELLSEYLGDYLTPKVQHLTLFNPCGCPGDCINYQGKNDPRAEDALAAKLLFSRVWHHNF